MATVSGKTEPLSDELHLSGLKLDGSPTPAMATVFGKPEPLSDDLGLSDLKLRDKVAASPTASLIHQRRLTTSTSPASSLQMGGVGLTGTLPEKMEAASGEITSGSRLPFGSGAAIAQGVGLNSNYPVGAHTARTRPPMHFLDEDWTTLQNTNALVRMSLPCSDQSIRPTKMKTATLPRGVEVLRCWCGDLCKVKEVTDFSDWLGMKFFMCANYEEDPPVSISPYIRPPSPPPLCMYYRWIDTKKPDWAVTEIRERGRRAWASLDLEERRAKAAAEEKAEQEREWQEYCVKQRAFLDEMKKKNREEGLRLAEVYRQREEAREAERQMKKERARAAKAAEEAGDGKGKYPRWTQ